MHRVVACSHCESNASPEGILDDLDNGRARPRRLRDRCSDPCRIRRAIRRIWPDRRLAVRRILGRAVRMRTVARSAFGSSWSQTGDRDFTAWLRIFGCDHNLLVILRGVHFNIDLEVPEGHTSSGFNLQVHTFEFQHDHVLWDEHRQVGPEAGRPGV